MKFVWTQFRNADARMACLALVAMALIPVLEVLIRPFQGKGIENAPVLVQHLGLVFSMMGAIVAERNGHLSALGCAWKHFKNPWTRPLMRGLTYAGSSFICGLLVASSWGLLLTEIESAKVIAYSVPVWFFQLFLPIGFLFLGIHLGMRSHDHALVKVVISVIATLLGAAIGANLNSIFVYFLPCLFFLLLLLSLGAPIFVVLGGLGLLLLSKEDLPLASLALSHYQITVNPSLPALPLFTLAGLIFATTQAAQRLSHLFTAIFGSGQRGTVLAVAFLCTCFTALTGGSGVTILAMGGLLLPLLSKSNYPEKTGIGLITSASALGVLLAPSVPLIMYAVIARVPINTMFLAGLIPAFVMIFFLVIFGGFLRPTFGGNNPEPMPPLVRTEQLKNAFWQAKWELLAPVVAIGSLVSGLATPTEGAALTTAYAVVTQGVFLKELNLQKLFHCLTQTAQIIGGILLIMGMALGLTNFLIDAGIPDLAIDWVQSFTRNKYVFLLALNIFLLAAGALMEIYAAIIVLVPLLLPLALSYGIDPVHFGIIFIAILEIGFLCPPAGMNLYFSSAVFNKPLGQVASSVVPAVIAIFLGSMTLSCFPFLVKAVPNFFASGF
jgi:tripartite ATP-independent transporter DctM subunit